MSELMSEWVVREASAWIKTLSDLYPCLLQKANDYSGWSEEKEEQVRNVDFDMASLYVDLKMEREALPYFNRLITYYKK